MNTRRIGKLFCILAGLLLVVVLVAVSWEAARPHEPAYQGKTLSVWLWQLEEGKSRQGPDQTEFATLFVEPTQNAVRHMGTNALPVLLRMVGAHDSPLRLRAMALLSRLRVVRWQPATPTLRRGMALDSFAALGTNAQPAVPALIVLLDDRDVEIRKFAAWCLGSVGPVAEEAVPALLHHLADPDALVRDSSVSSLGLIHKRPELVIPALTERLRQAGVKWGALFSLGCFGSEAKAAVPIILALLDDPDEQTRTWAAMTLRRIDSEAATKAGVK